ncbi:MAG: hypothetical protein ACKO6N_04250 [Myxococcota bacterium]
MEQSFWRALSLFRAAASERLQEPDGVLELVPNDPDQVGFEAVILEGWHAFQATVERQQLRGLVSPRGEVLFAQGGDLSPLVDAVGGVLPDGEREQGLVERLGFLLGGEYTVLGVSRGLPHALSVQVANNPAFRAWLRMPSWEGSSEQEGGRAFVFCLMRAERGGRGVGSFQLMTARLLKEGGAWRLTLLPYRITSGDVGGILGSRGDIRS